MQGIMDYIRREPVRFAGFVRLLLVGLPAFGVVITDDQRYFILSAIGYLIGEAGNEIARSKVTPMASVEAISPSTAERLK